MKILFIGGTGNISTSVSKLAVEKGIDLHLLNRGESGTNIEGARRILADVNRDNLSEILHHHQWDCVVNWIAFNEDEIRRDLKLFSGKTKQYIFISSASVYQKPLPGHVITESTPAGNPYWQYAQDKLACEKLLDQAHRKDGFPAIIVRPSLTYDTFIPLAIGGGREYTVIDRMKKNKKVIAHGDGTSLWTVTHAADFARGFLGLPGNTEAIGQTFHITTDEVLTWNEIYEMAGEAVGVKPQLVHIPSEFIGKFMPAAYGSLLGDKSHSAMFDNSKIKKYVPEFKARILFKDGIKRTIDWFESNPERQIFNPRTNDLMDKIIRLYETAYDGSLT